MSMRCTILWLVALAVAACATGCRTGQQYANLEPSAAAIERANFEILARYGGAYTDPALQAYVDRVGARVLAATPLATDQVRFVLIDTDVVNAYAVPGATVYVTRGLLAWLNSEAELAGVIAHELAHLTENHVAEAREVLREAEQRATAEGLLEPDEETTAQLRAHSRENELEADRVGLGYLVAAGYPGIAMLNSQLQFDATEQISRLERGVTDPLLPAPGAMATHPSSTDRVDALMALPNLATPGDDGRDAYLAAIDGIPFGPNPDDWQIAGGRVVQPVTRIAFDGPEGFSLAASAGVVSGAGPRDSALVIDFIPRDDQLTPAGYLAAEFDMMQLGTIEPQMIGGYPGAVVAGRRVDSGREWTSLVAAVGVRDDALMRILAVGSVDSADVLREAFDTVLDSMTTGDAAVHTPQHALVVHTVVSGEDTDTLAARLVEAGISANYAEDLLRALNALGPDDPIETGQTVKLVASGGA